MKLCEWCEKNRASDRFCSVKCRQAAFRLRRRRGAMGLEPEGDSPEIKRGRFAYADPPYPGKAHLYKDQPTYAGEVDHRTLVASLTSAGYVGWALSTHRDALKPILALVPDDHIVGAWVKPIGVSGMTYGPHNTWEPLIVVGGRKLRPGKRDWLEAQPARLSGDDLIGRKPLAFCAWLFDMLGMLPGDELVDLFPGTGIVSRAWAELSRAASRPGANDERERFPLFASFVGAATMEGP